MPLVNTGYFRKQQKDVNPNSPTFNTLRWVNGEGQHSDCPLPIRTTFRSVEISELVYRNNCGAGYYGGSYLYTLAEGHYVSIHSQEEADDNARAYFDSTKQDVANNYAQCFLDEEEPVGDCPPLGHAPECPEGYQAQILYFYDADLRKKCAEWSCESTLNDGTGGGVLN